MNPGALMLRCNEAAPNAAARKSRIAAGSYHAWPRNSTTSIAARSIGSMPRRGSRRPHDRRAGSKLPLGAHSGRSQPSSWVSLRSETPLLPLSPLPLSTSAAGRPIDPAEPWQRRSNSPAPARPAAAMRSATGRVDERRPSGIHYPASLLGIGAADGPRTKSSDEPTGNGRDDARIAEADDIRLAIHAIAGQVSDLARIRAVGAPTARTIGGGGKHERRVGDVNRHAISSERCPARPIAIAWTFEIVGGHARN